MSTELFPAESSDGEPEQQTVIVKRSIAIEERGLQLRSFDEMQRFANIVVQSGLAPSSYKNIAQVCVGIQFGAELGLTPMQSLQSIAVINGRATVWGDAIPGLVWGSGLCEGVVETIEGEGDKRTAKCVVRRKGVAEPIAKTFSVADAKKANLWGKSGPWSSYPDRMMAMRARAFAMRDAFADVLRGVQIREEVEDYADAPVKVSQPGFALPAE